MSESKFGDDVGITAPPVPTSGSDSTSDVAPAGRSETPTRLLRTEIAAEHFTNVIFSDSHGAFGDFLGAGYLYYCFASALRSQVSVCIGSGGGFVPGLLAQAQRDLSLEPSATYLIDANLPDLGFGSPVQPGGWLRPESEFRRRNSDLFVLPMLSHDAAGLFARQGVLIDYLHIDGDHSRRGVVADFEDFAPLLSPRGIISLHDLSLPGVTQAMEQIQSRHPGWDCLRFSEIGVGTAFMRRHPEHPPDPLPLSAAKFVDRNRRVRLDPLVVETSVTESRERARFERWHYLETSAYRSRYNLIAERIDRPGGVVVEIGGFPNSIIDVLHRSARLLAIEPYAPDAYRRRIEQVAAERGIDVLCSPGTAAALPAVFEDLSNFALVWLGLDLTAACDGIEEFHASLAGLLGLVGRADIVALELPDYAPSILVWKLVEECLSPAIEFDITLDLSADPVGDEFGVKDGRAKRRIIVFRPKAQPSPPSHEKIDRCAERLQLIKQRDQPSTGAASAEILRFCAAELPSALGKSSDGIDRTARPETDKPGCLTYGPYVRLAVGNYRAVINYASPAPAEIRVGAWDVCVGIHNVIQSGPLAGTDGETGRQEVEFTLSRDESQFPVELRTYFEAVAELRLHEIAIERIGD